MVERDISTKSIYTSPAKEDNIILFDGVINITVIRTISYNTHTVIRWKYFLKCLLKENQIDLKI